MELSLRKPLVFSIKSERCRKSIKDTLLPDVSSVLLPIWNQVQLACWMVKGISEIFS